MNQKFTGEIHKALCKYYVQNFGNSVHKLPLWRFSFTDCVTIPELKKIYDKFDKDSEDEHMVRDAFEELATKGHLAKLEWGYNLTEGGLLKGTQGKLSLVLIFLNKNPGAAIIVSIFSFLVSIAALYISYAKP